MTIVFDRPLLHIVGEMHDECCRCYCVASLSSVSMMLCDLRAEGRAIGRAIAQYLQGVCKQNRIWKLHHPNRKKLELRHAAQKSGPLVDRSESVLPVIYIRFFLAASFTILADEFPDSVSTMFGTCETFSGLGFMLGPVIGGALFHFGGFITPFLVLGLLVVLVGLLAIKTLPLNKTIRGRDYGTFRTYIKIPGVLVTLLAVFTITCGMGFIDAAFTRHLRKVWHSSFLCVLRENFNPFCQRSGQVTLNGSKWTLQMRVNPFDSGYCGGAVSSFR